MTALFQTQPFDKHSYVPGSLLGTLHVLSHLILATVLKSRPNSHSIAEETDSEGSRSLFIFTKLTPGNASVITCIFL